jgi:hypothetical protein
MHRDCETTCGEEVCRDAQRGRARSAYRADPQGQGPGSPGAEGAHPAESRCLGSGDGWSDSRIAEALDTSTDTIIRTRQHLVEGGVDAALTRRHSPNSARRRISDGQAEAKLIALVCSPPPKGRQRWTLTLLETAVVELNIVDRASDNTIGGRKKTAQAAPAKAVGDPAGRQRRFRGQHGGRAGGLPAAA